MTLTPTRMVLILAATTALSGVAIQPAWAQMPKPNFPIRQDPPAGEVAVSTAPAPTPTAEPAPVREDPPMPARPEPEGVQSRPLTEIARRNDVPAATPAVSAPTRARVVKTMAAGKVVSAQGPESVYTVKKGDNLRSIARKMGVDQEDLAKENGLKPPYRLMPGDELKGPRSSAKAYVVTQGDTLYAIARRFSVTPQAIAQANGMSVKAGLSAGKRLILPDGYKDKGPIRAEGEAASEPPEDAAPPAPAPSKTKASRKKPEPEPEPEAEAPAAGTRSAVTGKVIEVAGRPTTYKVRKHDNLDAIADDMGLSRKELADLNHLKSPYRLKPGQVLKGPARREKAYVPVEGDTLTLIGKRFGVTPKALAAANGLRANASIRPGKRLILPANARDRGPVRETVRESVREPVREPAREPVREAPPKPPTTYNPPPPVRLPPAQPPAQPPYNPPPRQETPPATAPSSGPMSDAQISSLGRGRFIWPLRGEIISTFGPKGTGQRNDGINIRASADDVVRSAAAGDVVYAGDQVPGFGNLVLVKHADGWVTAYGHLGRVDVKMQQKVVQGQQLGMAGQTGGVGEPQLHFEVRYAPSPTERARPVDPQLVLGR